jgi:cytochrome P450
MDDLEKRIVATDFVQAVNSYYTEYGPLVRHKINGEFEVYAFSPVDSMHVFRNDNAIPQTSLTELWPLTEYGKARGLAFPFSSLTEEWKRVRSALQKDIFSPASAASYIPALDASLRANIHLFDKAPIDTLLPYLVFDMFTSALFGKFFSAADRAVNSKEDEIVVFVNHTIQAFQSLLTLYFDYSTRTNEEKLAKYFSLMDIVCKNAEKLYHEMKTNKTASLGGGIPYLERVIARGEVTEAEITETVVTFLFASVDSTSHVVLWLILNIARFPEVRKKLSSEIKSVVGDGPITEDHLSRLEYLRQVVRESHRFTPNIPITTSRTLDHPIELSGYNIPPGVKIHIATSAVQWDPNLVDQPDKFIPERWSKAAQQARKGTEKEVIDNLAIAKPFGVGPRMCLAARFADIELRLFACHLVRSWYFRFDPPEQEFKITMTSATKATPYPKIKFEAKQ